jgi:NB-ARC domain
LHLKTFFLFQVTELDQNDKLFFILIYKNKDLIRFRDAIAEDYSWLSEKLKSESVLNETNDQLIMKYKSAINKSDIPKTKDRHIHRCKYLWEIQRHLYKLEREQFLCLHGKVGYGKRWLARDACSDFNVVKRMGFKIFWVNVSKCTTPEMILGTLNYLKIMFHATGDVDEKFTNLGSNNIQNEIAHIKRYLRNVLESNTYRHCLIILSDVQNIETWKAFDLHCKTLLITKYVGIIDEIPEESKFVVNVSDGFCEEESFSLLSTALNTTPNRLPQQAHEIHEQCKGYPIVIAKIAKSFVEFIKEPNRLRNKRWNDWVNKLREHNVEEPIPMIDQTIKHLTNDLQDYYKSLVIFTDNVNIPIKVLEKYWKTTDRRTEEIVKKFEKNSLLEINYVETDELVCSLHYLYYVHLKKTIDSNESRQMHQNFVDSYE